MCVIILEEHCGPITLFWEAVKGGDVKITTEADDESIIWGIAELNIDIHWADLVDVQFSSTFLGFGGVMR